MVLLLGDPVHKHITDLRLIADGWGRCGEHLVKGLIGAAVQDLRKARAKRDKFDGSAEPLQDERVDRSWKRFAVCYRDPGD